MVSHKKFYIKKELLNKDNKLQEFEFHPVIYAIIQAGLEMVKDNRHFFGLITGNVGDGKSNLVASLVSLWESEFSRRMDFDNIVWTSKRFTEKTDRDDNKTKAIWWDEAIQGATGKKVALTSEGELLKISLVTKRFKKHFYILVVDEIEEYSWKLIKMANFWFHVKTKYRQRGYFDGYLDKKKLKTIYQAFKYYKWDWSRITIKPDVVGKFKDYLGVFFDQEEYDSRKLEETRVNEKEKDNTPISKIKNLDSQELIKLKNKGLTQEEIADIKGVSQQLVSKVLRQMKNTTTNEASI